MTMVFERFQVRREREEKLDSLAQEIAQGVVLLVKNKGGSIGQMCVFLDLDALLVGTQDEESKAIGSVRHDYRWCSNPVSAA